MCGRYIANTEDEILEIREILTSISIRLDDNAGELNFENQDTYPGKLAPIIYLEKEKGVIRNSTFGLDYKNKKPIFNARIETVLESNFFYYLTKGKRCIIPASGYYEWKKLDLKSKDKYIFKTDKYFYFAGLYDEYKNQFVIMTKNPIEKIESIHNRMPVNLKEEYINDWLVGNIRLEKIGNFLNENIYFQRV